jgi:hypothetical protein
MIADDGFGIDICDAMGYGPSEFRFSWDDAKKFTLFDDWKYGSEIKNPIEWYRTRNWHRNEKRKFFYAIHRMCWKDFDGNESITKHRNGSKWKSKMKNKIDEYDAMQL